MQNDPKFIINNQSDFIGPILKITRNISVGIFKLRTYTSNKKIPNELIIYQDPNANKSINEIIHSK